MGRLFQHDGKGILINGLYRDVRLRGHAVPFRRKFKAHHLPGVHPAVGQHRLAVRKKAAAPELDCPGKVGGNGTLAQKIAHKRAIAGLFIFRHRKIQPHIRPSPLRKIYRLL